MANNIYACTTINGGTAGALDDIDHNNLSANDLALVVETAAEANKFYVYRYDTSYATAGESSPYYIGADSDSGAGRGAGDPAWVLCTSQTATWSNMVSFLAATSLSNVLNAFSIEYDQIWIPAAAFVTMSSNASLSSTSAWNGTPSSASNTAPRNYLAFDASSAEQAGFDVVMPPMWDRGTVKFKAYWAPAASYASSDAVVWKFGGIAVGNSDSLDVNPLASSTVTVTDQVLSNSSSNAVALLHVTGATSAMTINGNPALGDMIHFQVQRSVSSASDDLAVDARLLGVLMQIKYSNEVSTW